MAERLLIVGGGTMGVGIAIVGARGGYEVEIVEPMAAARERGRAALEREARRSGELGILERIRWTDAIAQRCEVALAIEAVTERFEVKRDVLVALSNALTADALIATNTSSLSVDELGDVVEHSERVVGLHFFNPPTKMELVEVVPASQTSDDALERAYAAVSRFGKTAVLAADTPGFIVNRVARPYYLQALRALERGVASTEELDALARGLGFRMGPFELMDLIGLDVNLATSESIYARTEAARFEPVELQRRMVAQGRLGRKSGAGFYQYGNGEPERFQPPAGAAPDERNAEEMLAILGFGQLADELTDAVEERYAHVQRIENDEMLDELSAETTMLIDVGDGVSDRSDAIARLDGILDAETIFFIDAYATDVAACTRRLRHPERVVGHGVLGSFAGQRAIEILDSEAVADDALELAQEFFAAVGKGAVLVEDVPGLFLGRTVGSIINEAMIAVHEGVATSEDVDTAMRLGANYPFGPIARGREIGGARLMRILKRLAESEGDAFAPHRSLWVLDVEEAPASEGAVE
jgi:3-hydroxybutyryl-CoA dehydrogenase